MKRKPVFAILIACVAFFIISFAASAGDQQNGTNQTSHYYDSEGNYSHSKTYVSCDPCGSTLRSIFFCNCGGDGDVLISFDEPG